MRDEHEVADAIGDAIRARVHPLAGPHAGAAILAALSLRGWRLVRANATLVDSDWLASVMVELNNPVRRDYTPGQKAAMYDKLVHKLESKGRGRI